MPWRTGSWSTTRPASTDSEVTSLHLGGDAIAIAMARIGAGDEARGWCGGPSRLTGGPASSPPAYKLLGLSSEAPGDGLSWRGHRVSTHREEPGHAHGLVLAFIDIRPEVADEFEDWYETEHMPRLAALPGMLRAARYRASPGYSPAHLACYLMDDLALSQSPRWLEAARTPWSARIRRFTAHFSRYSFGRMP